MIVAIIGIDGSGKTTQAKMLVSRLSGINHGAIYVRPAYVLLNAILPRKDKNAVPISPRKARVSQTRSWPGKFLLLGLIGYFYALASYLFIKFYFGRNRVAVCDRYFYQYFFDILGDFSKKVIRAFPKPDITFFLAGDLDALYPRMDDSFDGAVKKDYYEAVAGLFNELLQKQGFVRIDASLSKEDINDIIFEHLVRRLES